MVGIVASRFVGRRGAAHEIGSYQGARPNTHRFGDALQVLGPEVLKLEEIAEKLSGAFGDDEHVWFGETLEARRRVRRLADDAALLRASRIN